MLLKPHNIRQYEEVLEILATEKSVGLVQCPGSGKSYISLNLMQEEYANSDVLYVAPNRNILRNFRRIEENKHSYTTYMTYSKLARVSQEQLTLIANKYQLIVLDELHRAGAEKWGEAVNTVIGQSKDSQKLLGLSATPIRYLDDSRNMVEELFEGRQVTGPTIPEAIKLGILPNFEYVSVYFDYEERVDHYRSLLDSFSGNSAYTAENLRAEFELGIYNVTKIDEIIKSRVGLRPNGKWIVFANSLDELVEMDQNLKLWFGDEIKIFKIAHKLGIKANDESESEFIKCKEACVMVCIEMLNEGVHIEDVAGILMINRTESPNRWEQWIGRALSSGNTVDKIFIFDLVANHNNIRARFKERSTIVQIAREAYNERESERICIVEDYTLSIDELFEKLETVLVSSSSPWQAWEDQILKDNQDKSDQYIRKNLLVHRTEVSIKWRRRILGLVREYSPAAIMDFDTYPEREKILREQFPLVGPNIPAFKKIGGLNSGAIRYRAYGLGLTVVPVPKLTENQRIERMRLLIEFNGSYYGFNQEEFEKFLFWYPIAGSRGDFKQEGNEYPLSILAKTLGVSLKPESELTQEERLLRFKAYALYKGDTQAALDADLIFNKFDELKTEIPELRGRLRSCDIRDIAKRLGFDTEGMTRKLFALEGTLLDFNAHPESESILKELYPISGAQIGYFKSMDRSQIAGVARRFGLLRLDKCRLTKEQLIIRALNIAEFSGSYCNLTCDQVRAALTAAHLPRKEIAENLGCSVEDVRRLFTDLKITKGRS